jgi:hypothetical protein
VPTAVVALLYAAACALVAKDAYDTGEATATWGQLTGSTAVALGLVVTAVAVGRRPALIVPGPAPRPAFVVGAAALAMLGWVAIPPTRIGTAAVVLLALGATRIVLSLSRRGDWGHRHELALASGALVAAGGFAFLTTPIGEVSDAEKYGHNVALLALVVVLCAAASLRTGGAGPRRAHVSA